ncbi:MAG: hypothetical protein RLZZ360_162 [Candidatus Parcubacteria bacterium]|jgi:hypothetical protein
MNEVMRSITWEAPERARGDKGGDWYFALTILTVAIVIAAIIFGNFLFAILAGLSGASLAVAASQPPRIIRYGVSVRGITEENSTYPFTSLKAYSINEDDPRGPQLLVLSNKNFAPMIVMPIPEEYIDEIDDILAERLPEEALEEPLFNRLLELAGF